MNTLFTSFLLLGGVVAGLTTVRTDVVVIGGGSSGIYTGIQLMDQGKDVVIIEKSSFIGSHANTYYDPATNAPKNVGVQGFHNVSVVRDYFARLNVTVTGGTAYPIWPTVNVDFTTGEEMKNYTAPEYSAVLAAFQTLRDVLAEKYAYLDAGFFLPDPIPDELFLPFSEFAAKYGVEDVIPQLVNVIQPVEIWKEVSLYVIKNFGVESVENYITTLTSGAYVPNDVNEIYRSATNILGSRVILNSTAQSACSVLKPKKIVMAAPPHLRNFAGWDLSANETALFSKFRGKDIHIAITRNPEWNNTSYNGIGPNYTATTPRIPGTVSLTPNGFTDSSYYSYIAFPDQVSVADAQTLFKQEVNTLIANGVVPQSDNEIIEWFDHNQYMNYVPTADIKSGFYTKLNNLQGVSNTFYVGAAWAGQDSSYIWAAAHTLMPKILA
ncbi:hypothetical protein BKA61DRAFT_682542 [Leptodontidium sp. MPI-SDFR-AT-0119]|nr:hypothetical protein BKA61DRAFT_682542 [Leptodontidium sp. MPI-SDFR-AT-0119]